MLAIILFVVVIIFISRHNSRITNLEKLLENQGVSQSQTGNIGPAPSPLNPVVSAVPQNPTPIPVPVAPPQVPVSSEEVWGKRLGIISIVAVLGGVAFFLKYAFENNWIGPSGRVMIGILVGVVFLVVGQFLRKKYLQYSDILMGGGIAVLYLSVFSAQSFYNLIDPFTAGIFMFCVTVLAFAISIVNATQTLAVIAILGGFATPFLSGSQENNMLALFGYVTILNMGVLGVSFFKKWPKLLALAFLGTVVTFLVWFGVYYQEMFLAPVMMFVFVSFCIFLIASVARAITAGIYADSFDYFLMGGNAFCFAVVSYVMLAPSYSPVLGFWAVCIALIYMAVAYATNRFNPADKALNIFLPGLAVTFLSIAVPLQFSGPWIAVAWLVESVALYVIASLISNRGFQVMGAVIYVLGLISIWWLYVMDFTKNPNSFIPIFNSTFAITTVAIVVAYIIAFIYMKYGSITETIRERGIAAFVVVANILTIVILTLQVYGFYNTQIESARSAYSKSIQESRLYNSGYDQDMSLLRKNYTDTTSRLKNESNIAISIMWALYAAVLTAIGFAKRFAGIRRLGLILFVITGVKVLIDVWDLGQLYRIISFTAFGILALIASFVYAKYKDRLKTILTLVLVVSAGLSFSVAHAVSNLEDWQYTRTLSVPVGSDFAKVVLPPDISRGGNNFNDIRIINQNGTEVPYLITRNIATKGGIVSGNIVDKSTINGSTQFIVDSGVGGVVRTRIMLSTTASNFKRQVSIYTSGTSLPISSPSWALVTDKGYIFKFTDSVTGFSSGQNSIDFSAQTGRYFKVVISEGVEGPINISGVTLYGDVSVHTPTYTKELPVSVYNNLEKKITEITLDLGVSGYLTNAVTITSSDLNYNRKVIVESSESTSSWVYISQGYISNISTSRFVGTSNRIVYPEQKTRYIRLSIVNDDNTPLKIGGSASIEGPIVSAIFRSIPGDTSVLYYGNLSARNPVYDITRIASYIEEETIPDAVLGQEIINPIYKAPTGPVIPFTESHRWLLNTLLVIVVLGLGVGIGFYLMHFRKAKIGFDQNNDESKAL